jgi:hypothetical protein
MYHGCVSALVAKRYAAVYGATPQIQYPDHVTVHGDSGVAAVLGYRMAADQPLFLERYLDAPIEDVLSTRFGRSMDRARIVEIGEHASSRSRATLALWMNAADHLQDRADIAVAVLTAPLRAMFERVGLPVIALAPASASRLGDDAGDWGRYYDADPIVCAGEIAVGRACLAAGIAGLRSNRP